MRWASLVLEAFLNVFAPPACAACEAACEPGQAFCGACGELGRAGGPALLDGRPLATAGPYAPPLSTAIQRFKYQGRAELAGPLSRLLLPALESVAAPVDAVLVPVPLHAKRLAARGYNQAALLASELGSLSGRTSRPRLLVRVRHTEQQVGKQRTERVANLEAAFRLRQPTTKSVVLVDDVITTGSTVRACAQALASANVRVVGVVALARARQD